MRILSLTDLYFYTSDDCLNGAQALRELADYLEDDSKEYGPTPEVSDWDTFLKAVEEGRKFVGGFVLFDLEEQTQVWP